MQTTGLDKYACRKQCHETKQSLCSKSCSAPQTRELAHDESHVEKRQITSPVRYPMLFLFSSNIDEFESVSSFVWPDPNVLRRGLS